MPTRGTNKDGTHVFLPVALAEAVQVAVSVSGWEVTGKASDKKPTNAIDARIRYLMPMINLAGKSSTQFRFSSFRSGIDSASCSYPSKFSPSQPPTNDAKHPTGTQNSTILTFIS
jgi:hypothetical protein